MEDVNIRVSGESMSKATVITYRAIMTIQQEDCSMIDQVSTPMNASIRRVVSAQLALRVGGNGNFYHQVTSLFVCPSDEIKQMFTYPLFVEDPKIGYRTLTLKF